MENLSKARTIGQWKNFEWRLTMKPKIIGNAHKILGRASSEIPYDEACKFLKSAQIWDELSVEDREAFCRRGVILDSVGGHKLAKLIALRSAEQFVADKHAKRD